MELGEGHYETGELSLNFKMGLTPQSSLVTFASLIGE
jgi:hypothetical protein